MELQLGLALPSNPINGFDLNSYGYEPIEALGSDPLSHLDCWSSNRDTTNVVSECKKKKRCFDEAFEQDLNDAVSRTLPLFNTNKNYEDGVVGWPPIRSWRKKICNQNRTAENGFGGLKYKYVKVKMEGVAIARKVDLSVHHCYQTLTDTLIGMFGNCDENLEDYKLTYQDKEGDWLLAGDIPWGTFIQSVQRLKVLRSGN